MRILGIDPGTVTMGYGLIEGKGEEYQMVDYGILTASKYTPLVGRLHELYKKLNEIVTRHHPDEIAIEDPFVARNVRSALAIGQAQAVAILAATNNGISVCTYAPSKVKQAVAGYGSSNKEQVQEMVRIQLGLSHTPQPNDAADALAIALCHVRESHLSRLIAQSEQRYS